MPVHHQRNTPLNVKRFISFTLTIFLLSGCMKHGPNPIDPYEPINRKIYQFNHNFDAVLLKPPARVYHAVVPSFIRAGINNVYDNINMIPTVANDVLQWEWTYALKDTWRLIINTTMGVGGIFDVANACSLPAHSNDLGLTFAKWGDKHSPFVVIPFLGPSTLRDAVGLMFNYALLTPYPYINNDAVIYGLIGLRYVDLRAQMLETDRLFAEAIDQYSFIRDAYLQHRNYFINGTQSMQQNPSNLYVDDNEPEKPAGSDFPLTTD